MLFTVFFCSILFFFFFFFSSRRRHTRWNCDWSSDVCSSTWAVPGQALPARLRQAARARDADARGGDRRDDRSEERRVGKECRARGAGGQEKKRERKRGRGRGRENKRGKVW